MAVAGEVNQAIGHAYQLAFIGALEANIRYFENKFTVEREPEKTSFDARTGKGFSFDFCGVYNHPWVSNEVFGECKGYSKANGLVGEYKSFLAKAYVASTDYRRHRNDLFWFVTNVPFACNEGGNIRTVEFVQKALTDGGNRQVRDILGEGHIDDSLVRNLVSRIGVFILTDSYLMNIDLSYKVLVGDSLWSILKKFHAGQAPAAFRAVADQIAHNNGLASPDQVRSGTRIKLPWCGLKVHVPTTELQVES